MVAAHGAIGARWLRAHVDGCARCQECADGPLHPADRLITLLGRVLTLPVGDRHGSDAQSRPVEKGLSCRVDLGGAEVLAQSINHVIRRRECCSMQGSDDALDEPLSDIAGVGREAGLHILFDIRLLLRLLLWLLWSMIKSQLSNPQNWALTNGSSDAVTLSRVSQPYQRSASAKRSIRTAPSQEL